MDITATLAPKSNQMNADDLIVGPRTIIVTNVDVAIEAEQPVAIYFKGDSGRPWRPCKSMRRVLASAWGPDSSQYVGRGITLFRDPGALYGGQQVGGIRLSHLSHIEGPLTVMLTATRGKRLPYKVLPLRAPSPAAPAAAAAPPAPATEPGTAQRLPVGRTIVADDPQPAPAPAPATPAAGRRSAPAPVRRSGPGAAPAADAPIPGLD